MQRWIVGLLIAVGAGVAVAACGSDSGSEFSDGSKNDDSGQGSSGSSGFGGGDGATGFQCSDKPMGCAQELEKCSVAADCCGRRRLHQRPLRIAWPALSAGAQRIESAITTAVARHIINAVITVSAQRASLE